MVFLLGIQMFLLVSLVRTVRRRALS